MASEIRANKQTNRVGLGTVTYTDTGIIVSGIVTANSLGGIGHIYVGNNIKLGNAGVITATSFVGSGANLTGIDATAIKDTSGNVKIQAQASGAMHTGIHTFQVTSVSEKITIGTGNTLSAVGNATFTGIVTASSFSVMDQVYQIYLQEHLLVVRLRTLSSLRMIQRWQSTIKLLQIRMP